MPEEAKFQSPRDPMELWKLWQETWEAYYETSSRLWSNILDGGKETSMDPYGLYRSWVQSAENAQEQMKIAPFDPVTFFRAWYDATSETWSKVVNDAIGSEKFIEFVSRFLEGYSNFTTAFNRTNEEYFRSLQLPTRSDIARVAELVIALEEKIDNIDDAFEEFAERSSQAATGEAVEGLAGRLDRVESKLETLPADLERIEAVESLTNRLDRVESKLDTILSTLGKIEAREYKHPENGKANDAPRRKPPKKTGNSQGDPEK